MIKEILLYPMAIFYILGGIAHFRKRKFYRSIMPPYLPAHDFLISVSGIAEVGLGLTLLIPQTRPWAAWGIMALLVAVFPANIQMLLNNSKSIPKPFPQWGLLVRLPLQGVLILWAFWYT